MERLERSFLHPAQEPLSSGQRGLGHFAVETELRCSPLRFRPKNKRKARARMTMWERKKKGHRGSAVCVCTLLVPAPFPWDRSSPPCPLFPRVRLPTDFHFNIIPLPTFTIAIQLAPRGICLTENEHFRRFVIQ
jgi:hypothetical protein